jgi:hypothetical protein
VAAVAAAPGGARLQRKCTPAKKPFDLAGSAIGGRIRAGLEAIRVRVGPDDKLVPRVDPEAVLSALASSNCFLADTEAAAALAPSLAFAFHEDPERGTFFRGGAGKTPPTVTLQVTDLGEVVRQIVHEVVHASHRPTAPPGLPAKGSITRVEEASIGEEKSTRAREIEILEEINAAGTLAAKVVAPYAGTGAEEVRADFRSAPPKLTYQEFAIIEAKKNQNRVAGLVEDEVTALARRLLTHKAPRVETVDDFELTTKEIGRFREIGAETPPAEALTYPAAKDCVNRFYGPFTSPKGLPDGGAASAACIEFMTFARAAGLSAPISSDRLLDVWNEFRARRDIRAEAIATGSEVARFLDRVAAADRARAIEFLEWTMIAEAMAEEWKPFERGSDPKIRGLHLDLLAKRLGAALAGISRPAPGP